MRVLHTADWHLGRGFHGESLLDAQAAIVDHVVDTARSERVDAVLIAGDLYDRALPPVDAVRLAGDALVRLSEICPVVLISGNHDSAGRLAFASDLLDRAGVHVRTEPGRVGEPVVLGDACVYCIPYLEPDLVRTALGCEERSHAAAIGAAMERVRADLATRPRGTPSVVIAHAFVAGAAESGSERDLSVGGASSVAPSLFGGFDYVGLGHLHKPQKVGTNGRYAGSPIAFSFSEAAHRKSLAVVELSTGEAELVPFPVPRPLAVLRGTLDQLLTDSDHDKHEASWVQATLTDPVRPQDAMERLRGRFPHAVVLGFEPDGARDGGDLSYGERVRGLDDVALVEQFAEDVRGEGLSGAERELIEDAFTARRASEVSA